MKALTREVKNELAKFSNQNKAREMQRYMKSEMPFHGVQSPLQKKIFKNLFQQFPQKNEKMWRDGILDLWNRAEFREERYAAIALTAVKDYRSFQSMSSISVYEEMIVTGAWWDYVDSLSNRLAELLMDFPEPMTREMSRWARAEDMWKRRVSIICQLKYKDQTDTKLLFGNIKLNMADSEFFIRKAIGWALREYSKTSPDEVVTFVVEYSQALSPLSKREGLKHLLRKGVIDEIPG